MNSAYSLDIIVELNSGIAGSIYLIRDKVVLVANVLLKVDALAVDAYGFDALGVNVKGDGVVEYVVVKAYECFLYYTLDLDYSVRSLIDNDLV